MSEHQTELEQASAGTLAPATRSLAAVLRAQLDAGETMKLLVGIYGQALAANDPDRFSHVNVVLGGAAIKLPKLAGVSAVPNATAYVLATKDFLLVIGSVGAGQAAGVGVPVGTVLPFAGSTAPGGFLLCDGAAVSRSDYALLFSIIGTTYGAGNGSTTFNVPDFRGRTAYGAGGGGLAIGNNEGQSNPGSRGPSHHHSFSGGTSNAGNHQHPAVGDHTHGSPGSDSFCFTTGGVFQAATPGTNRTIITSSNFNTGAAGGHQHGAAGDHSHSVSGSTSGGSPTDVPSFLAVNYLIRAL